MTQMDLQIQVEPTGAAPLPTPATYVRLTIVSLWDNLPAILLGGAAFSALCVPTLALFVLGLAIPAVLLGALTIAPAWGALLAHQAGIVRDVGAGTGGFWKSLQRFWTRGAGLGLLVCFPLLAALLTVPALAYPEARFTARAGFVADVAGLILLAALYTYAFPLIVLYDADLYTALSCAVVLAGHHGVNTLGLLGMGVLFALTTLRVSTGLVFILPAVWGLFILNNCRMVVMEELAQSHR
jgi:uncharacterized membrane protein YesL